MVFSLPLARTPAMIGCSFVVNRDYFAELGLLDPGMDVYGGENIELGIRVCSTSSFCCPALFSPLACSEWSDDHCRVAPLMNEGPLNLPPQSRGCCAPHSDAMKKYGSNKDISDS